MPQSATAPDFSARTRRAIGCGLALLCAWLGTLPLFAAPVLPARFSFGDQPAPAGTIAVPAACAYDPARGFGFEPGPAAVFSLAVPEGNYRVTVTLGGPAAAMTTVKAETRRLLLETIATGPGETVTRSFVVNVRTPAMPPGNTLKLDPRERDPRTGRVVTRTWDDRLTLAFCGAPPAVRTVAVEPAPDAVTVFLLGDSTVTDQPVEPFGSWGQYLPRWFDAAVAVANHAESGETLKAFRAERRWDKVMSLLRPGDYVVLQFGHNDRNPRGHNGIWPAEDTMGDWAYTHAEAKTDYLWLLAAYAVEAKRRGAIPVIVSPMSKIDIRTGALNPAGLGDYPAAAAEAAKLAGAAFVDLNALSIGIVQALGPEAARRAYVDGLHTNSYGAYLLSRAFVEGVKRANLGLAQHLAADAVGFDPQHPRPLPDEFAVPLEPVPPANQPPPPSPRP